MSGQQDYIFLKDPNEEGQTTYYAINPEKIETLYVSDTYDRYGQSVSPENAGNYLTLNTQKAVSLANQAYYEKEVEDRNLDESDPMPERFQLGDDISAHDFTAVYEALQLDNLLKNGEDYALIKETCKGFNYWDGSNWQTVTVQVEIGEPTYTIEDDPDTITELVQAIEGKSFERAEFGKKIYSGNGYQITESFCQGYWEIYSLILE